MNAIDSLPHSKNIIPASAGQRLHNIINKHKRSAEAGLFKRNPSRIFGLLKGNGKMRLHKFIHKNRRTQINVFAP